MENTFLISMLVGGITYTLGIHGYLGKRIESLFQKYSKNNKNLFFFISIVCLIEFFISDLEFSKIYCEDTESETESVSDRESSTNSESESKSNNNTSNIENNSRKTISLENKDSTEIKTNVDANLSGNNLHVNSPNINISISDKTIEKTLNTLSTGVGLSAGTKLASQLPSPIGKAAAIVGTVGLAHSIKAGINYLKREEETKKVSRNINVSEQSKVLEDKISNPPSPSEFSIDSPLEKGEILSTVTQDNTNEFLFNMLQTLLDINGYLFLFLILLTISFISNIVTPEMIDKYVNVTIKNKFNTLILNKTLKKILNTWSKSQRLMFGLSLINIIIGLSFSRYFLIYLINYLS